MSRKLSEDGKIRIKNALAREMRIKGWYKQSSQWADEAYKIYKRQYPESNRKTGFSTVTWNKFRSGKPIDDIPFEYFCRVLRISNWQEVAQAEIIETTRNILSYISACGLNKPPEKRKVFNDYSGERAIDELWADPFAEKNVGIAAYIRANIRTTEKDKNFLRINFVRQGWGVNATIRPYNDTPINASNYQCIKFKIRSPQEQIVGVRIRIVDANYIFWRYGEHETFEYEGLSTSLNIWKSVVIPLKTKKWTHFNHDGLLLKGNQHEPNLKAIQLITFEVGSDKNPASEQHLTRLGSNDKEATIDISPIIFE